MSTAWERLYCGAPPDPATLLLRWNLDPVLLGLVAAAAWLVLGGPERGRGRLLAAVAVLAVLFVSPLCALTSALFSARSAHHLILIAVAAPLLASGLAASGRRARVPLGPGTAAVLHTIVLWLWHAPALYAAALGHVAIYWLMQASLLGTAVVLWRRVLAPDTELLPALLTLVGVMLQMGFLGAVLTFAREPLYAPHLLSTAPWGLSPLEDQQLAGLLMWAPGMLPYLFVALRMTLRALAGPSEGEGLAWSRS